MIGGGNYMKTNCRQTFTIQNAMVSITEEGLPSGMVLSEEIWNDLNFSKAIHIHTAYEIFFIGEKPLKIITPTQKFEYVQSVVLIPPCFEHYTIGSEYAHVFLFTVEGKQKNALSFITETETKQQIAIYPYTPRLQTLIDFLKELESASTSLNEYKLTHLYPLLFAELSDVAVGKTELVSQSVLQNDYLSQINAILTFEFMQDIQLKDVAQKLYLSEKQTARIIQKHFKQSFSALLLNRRLLVATLYLLQTEIKISEIIQLTGFQTENYFFSAFKKKYGMTPRAYRLQFR